MVSYDAGYGVEAETGSLADWLSGEERFEDPAFDVVRDTGAVIDDFNTGAVVVSQSADDQLALSVHGIGGVDNQIGPDLVQLAAMRADFGQGTVVFADDLDAVFQVMAQHQ